MINAKERCVLCGRSPATGFAMIDDHRYCHPDVGPSCYEAVSLRMSDDTAVPLNLKCLCCGLDLVACIGRRPCCSGCLHEDTDVSVSFLGAGN